MLENIQQQGLLTARMAARLHDAVAFKRGGVVHSCCELRRRDTQFAHGAHLA